MNKEDLKESEQKLLIKYQRDINSLSDPDRMIRLRGIIALEKNLVKKNKSNVENAAIIKIFDGQISRFMQNIISDQAEKIRENSLKMFEEYLRICHQIMTDQESSGLYPVDIESIKSIVKLILQRINIQPYLEQTEEVRLQIIQLLQTLVDLYHSEIVSIVGDIMMALSKSLLDHFPEVKKEIANLLIKMCECEGTNKYVGSYAEGVVKALGQNMGHQHTKVRKITMESLMKLLAVHNSGDKLEYCSKDIQKSILNDKSTEVRKIGYKGVHNLLISFNAGLLQKWESYLLIILVNGLNESFYGEIQQMLDDAGMKRMALAEQMGDL